MNIGTATLITRDGTQIELNEVDIDIDYRERRWSGTATVAAEHVPALFDTATHQTLRRRDVDSVIVVAKADPAVGGYSDIEFIGSGAPPAYLVVDPNR